MVKNTPASVGDASSKPGLGKIPWRRKGQPTLVFLPGKSQGQRRLWQGRGGGRGGYSPQGCKESDMTKQTHKQQQALEMLDQGRPSA